MNLPDVITGAVISQATKTVLEKVSPVLFSALAGQLSAFDQWMKFRGNQRLEDLVQRLQELEAENQNLQQTITDAEKLSPGSGHTKTIQEYITTPLDEKVEFLRNALINESTVIIQPIPESIFIKLSWQYNRLIFKF